MMKYILLIYISGINTVNKKNKKIHMKDCNVKGNKLPSSDNCFIQWLSMAYWGL